MILQRAKFKLPVTVFEILVKGQSAMQGYHLNYLAGKRITCT
jgi:hypothetical protein